MNKPKPHICFDLRPLQIGHQNRGIGMHIKSLLESLPDDGSILFSYYHFSESNPITSQNIKTPRGEMIATAPRSLAIKKPSDVIDSYKVARHRFNELRRKGITVFVQFDASLGLPRIHGIKTVAIAYDLIPLIMPNQYLPTISHSLSHSIGFKQKLRATMRSAYYRQKYNRIYRTIKRADLILSISEATRQSFIELLHIKENHIKTLYLAAVDFGESDDNSVVKRLSKPYIFYIGGTDFRKRVTDVVRIFNLLRSRGYDLKLVLAGNEFKDVKSLPDIKARHAITMSPYKDDIVLAGFVTDQQKRSLYVHAQAFVFTTAYEGFGLPILEAMSNKCPVVCYNNSSLPEVAGNGAILVDDGNYVAAAKEVARLIESKQLREDMKKRGLKQSQKFSWHRYVKEFLDSVLS